ncbi:hypothetical protein D3C78_1524100 [compost metagenome]
MVAYGVRSLPAIVVQGGFILCRELVDHPVAKFPGPGFDTLRAGMPVQLSQVVGDAAGTDQQHTLFAQAGQRLAHTGLQGRAASGRQ